MDPEVRDEERVLETERILQLADALERMTTSIPGFDMRAYAVFENGRGTTDLEEARDLRSCATAACLAGHAVTLFRDECVASPTISGAAAEILGLDSNQEIDLFAPGNDRKMWTGVTRERAVRTLRHLAATGKVDWSAALDAEAPK